MYASTGLSLVRKVMNTKGCRIFFPQQQRTTAVMALAIDNELDVAKLKVNFFRLLLAHHYENNNQTR